jgi:hypothetical protein
MKMLHRRVARPVGIWHFTLRAAAIASSFGGCNPRASHPLLGSPPRTFVAAYHANRQSACVEAIAESPFAAAPVAMIARTPTRASLRASFSSASTASDPVVRSRRLAGPDRRGPSPSLLRRLSLQLRQVDIIVMFSRHKDGRIIRIATPEALGQEMPV